MARDAWLLSRPEPCDVRFSEIARELRLRYRISREAKASIPMRAPTAGVPHPDLPAKLAHGHPQAGSSGLFTPGTEQAGAIPQGLPDLPSIVRGLPQVPETAGQIWL